MAKSSSLLTAFLEGFTLAGPRRRVAECLGKSRTSTIEVPKAEENKRQEEERRLREEEERKRREQEELRKKSIEEFRIRCKGFGWLMAFLHVILFLTLMSFSVFWCKGYPFVRACINVISWIFSLGVATYACFNMFWIWEHFFDKWVHKNMELFNPPAQTLPIKRLWDFWRYMMMETMSFGFFKRKRVMMKCARRPNDSRS